MTQEFAKGAYQAGDLAAPPTDARAEVVTHPSKHATAAGVTCSWCAFQPPSPTSPCVCGRPCGEPHCEPPT